MNPLRLLIFAATLLLSFPVCAATDAAREFEQLTFERDQAVEPINRRYQLALESLLRRATTANDFETAGRIKQALEKLSTKPAVAVTAPKLEFLGSWKFFNHVDKHTALVELNADKTYSEGGKRIGTWEVIDKQLIITYDAGGTQDRYNLPVRENKLVGKNTPGHPLNLSRKTD